MNKYPAKLHSTLLMLLACTITANAEVVFKKYRIVHDEAETWWARNHADVNGDGLLDFFVINNNANGGWLGWYETKPDFSESIRHIIAKKGPNGIPFAAGDLASGDIDNDGDIDVLGPVSPGEWGGSDEPTTLYWYENPDWEAHLIGEYPCFVKDFDLVDLNADGKLDVAATTHNARKMYVYRQDSPDSWTKAAEVYVNELHEGQDVGDVDGDGDIDVISTAFCMMNPGGDMTGTWTIENIDPYWNSDTIHSWEYNATKIICADIDGDGRDEVFISCSEKHRTRIAWYDYNPEHKIWKVNEIGNNALAHTLQVGDINGDGDLDVLSGNNRDQQWRDFSPVIIFYQNKDPEQEWQRWSNQQILTMEGAYNSYLGDVEGDGDLDFFRYAGHMGKFYELWLNEGEAK
ncbi:MAG: FG-GAP repeat domain-containing protein [Puniceicoccaceae bacterium]